MMSTREQSLVARFDAEVVHERTLTAASGDPGAVRRALENVLDQVAAGVGDPIGRHVVEMARQAVVSLDTVVACQERPRAESRRSSFGLRDFFGSDEPAAPPPRVWAEVSVGRLLDAVRATLQEGERVRREAVPPPPEIVVRPWAEDPGLVRLLHDLLAAARRSDDFVKVRIAEQLADDLRLDHGIEVVEYDEAVAAHFTQVQAPVEAPRTIAPALLRDGVLLRAGEAHVPQTPLAVVNAPAPAPANVQAPGGDPR